MSGKDYCACFPKFTDDYKHLVYFGTQNEFITHSTCFELRKVNFEDFEKNVTLVE